jgi:hypothetical protein
VLLLIFLTSLAPRSSRSAKQQKQASTRIQFKSIILSIMRLISSLLVLVLAGVAVANTGQQQMVSAAQEVEKQHHARSLGQGRERQTFTTKSGVNCYSGDGAEHTYREFTNDFAIQNSSEFKDFLDPNATGYGFGACSRMINGNFLGLAYVCQNKTHTENCLCFAEYNGTVCSSCTVCDASALAALENFQADCSNVNGKCKIECGQGVGTTQEDNVTTSFTAFTIVRATKDVCPYPTTSPPSTESSHPSPPSSDGARQQLKSTCWVTAVLVAALFWIN